MINCYDKVCFSCLRAWAKFLFLGGGEGKDRNGDPHLINTKPLMEVEVEVILRPAPGELSVAMILILSRNIFDP